MFKKFPKIRGFHNVVKEVRAFPIDGAFPEISFRSKIKIHGTNSGVRILPDGSVFSQKRNGDCGEMGHFNFPVWVKGNETYFSSLKHPTDTYIVYGEWAGKGIQNKVAVSDIDKSFFIFTIRQMSDTGGLDEDGKPIIKSNLIIDPDEISDIMGETPDNVYVLPWYEDKIDVDFNSQSNLENVSEIFNSTVEEIDKCDPYIKKNFDVEGFGEGLVYYPLPNEGSTITSSRFTRYAFKVKGESHSKSDGAGKKARVKTPTPQGVYDFVDMMLTEDRLNQGIKEVCGEAELTIKQTGQYIGWVCRDVASEGADELLEAKLEWKEVQGTVATRAREFFISEVKKI